MLSKTLTLFKQQQPSKSAREIKELLDNALEQTDTKKRRVSLNYVRKLSDFTDDLSDRDKRMILHYRITALHHLAQNYGSDHPLFIETYVEITTLCAPLLWSNALKGEQKKLYSEVCLWLAEHQKANPDTTKATYWYNRAEEACTDKNQCILIHTKRAQHRLQQPTRDNLGYIFRDISKARNITKSLINDQAHDKAERLRLNNHCDQLERMYAKAKQVSEDIKCASEQGSWPRSEQKSWPRATKIS